MNRICLILVLLAFCSQSYASTFVGNGGSVLDSELRSSLGRLKKAVRAIDADNEICECAGDSSQCGLLKDLNDEELDFCASFVENIKQDLMSVMNDKYLKFRWTSKVQGQDRNFDAAASASTKTIILDEKRFASISSADRMQLLAHELLHLLKYQGEPLVDKGQRGPFKGEEGGRRLLDTAGAAIVIIGMRAKVLPLEESAQSKPFKNLYIEYSGGSRYLDSGYRKSAIQAANVRTISLELSWYPRHSDNFGYSIGFYSEDEKHERYPELSLMSEHKLQAGTVGVSYRVLPLELGIAWLDAIQVSATARVGYGQVTHSFKDDYNKLSGRTSLPLFETRLNAQLPLLWNFWFTLSQGLIYTPYEIGSLKIKSKTINSNNSIGVSYGLSL